jgi:hypothetical protein
MSTEICRKGCVNNVTLLTHACGQLVVFVNMTVLVRGLQ